MTPWGQRFSNEAKAATVAALLWLSPGGLGAALSPCPTPDASKLLIQPNQTIAFMGDSITFQGNYTRQVEAYLKSRYPSYNLNFVNTGIGGWTAPDAETYSGPLPAGLAYVLSIHPDIVTICLGMNDNHYTAYNSTSFTSYTNSMSSIVSQLKAAGIEVALVTPGMVDLSVNAAELALPIDPSYNSVLQTYANWVLTYAASQNIPAFDLHTLMMNADAAAKAAMPGFVMLRDGIHPDMAGGIFYAYGILKALGVPTECREIGLDAGAFSISGGGGFGMGSLQSVTGGWSFSFTSDPMPFVPGPGTRSVLGYLPFQQDFNRIQFSAAGLTATSYDLLIDGYRQGPISQTALAAGINLADYWTQPSSSIAEIHTVQLIDDAQFAAPPCYGGSYLQMIDDMEKANINSNPAIPYASNLWGGHWDSYGGGAGSYVSPAPQQVLVSGPGHNSAYAARITGTVGTGGPQLSTQLSTRNLNPGDGVQFWFKANAGCNVIFQVRLHSEVDHVPTYYGDYGYSITGTGSWAFVSVPYSSLVRPGWQAYYPFDSQDIYNLNWLVNSVGNYDVSVDDLQFFCSGPSASPPPPPLASPTPAPTFAQGTDTITQAMPAPNPNPKNICVFVDGQLNAIQCRLYTAGFQLVWKATLSAAMHPGWNCLPLPSGWDTGLGNAVYFLAMDSPKSGGWVKGPTQRIYLAK